MTPTFMWVWRVVRRMMWWSWRSRSLCSTIIISSVRVDDVNSHWVLQLEEDVMVVYIFSFTILAEIVVWALRALVSHSYNWRYTAAITGDSVMNNVRLLTVLFLTCASAQEAFD